MTKKSKFHTDVSKMRFDGRVNQAYWNGLQAVRMIYNKEVVFNRAEYHLDVPETVELEAYGTKDEPLSNFIGVESYKFDYDGTRSEVEYRGGSDKIAPNNTTEPKEGEYTITQGWSALQISGKWTQAGKELMHYAFKQIRSVSVDYGEAYASGGNVEPYVTINVWLLEIWSDGSTVDKYTEYRGTVTSATGKVIAENAVGSYSTINSKTGVVTVPSLGTTERAARNVFTVETMAGTVIIPEVDGGRVVEWSWNGGLSILQMENYRHTTHLSYDVSVSANPATGVANSGNTTSKISATAYQNVRYTWDSGAPYVDDRIGINGTLSTNLGTLSANSVTGSGSATLTLGENISAARTATITLSAAGIKKTCTVSQNAVSYVLTKGEDKECSATASTINVSFTSSRNGSALEPTFTANISGVTFGTISRSGTTYTVPVNIPENKESAMRTIIITATQTRYDGNKTAQVIITQAAAAADNRPKAAFVYVFQYNDASKSNVAYSVYFDASQKKNGEYVYQGGKFTNVVIQLNTQENGGGSVLGDSAELGDVTVSQGGKSKTYSGTIKAGQSCYVRVYYDNTWQVVTPPDDYQPE